VTATSIRIGFGDDAGFATAPGLNHQQSDAVRAMVAWCNLQGGIRGRKIEATYYDAKVFEVNNVLLDACKNVFMLVGQGFSLDSGQEETRVSCGLASVAAWAVSPAFAHGPDAVFPVPNPVDLAQMQNAAWFARAFPDRITHAAVMFGNYPATVDTKDKALATYPAYGFDFGSCPQLSYNIAGEDDWTPFAQTLKNCGAQVVYYTGTPAPVFENFVATADKIGFRPLYITDANFYDPAFAAWNTKGYADRVYVRQTFVPLEEASVSPGTRAYLDVMAAAGGDTDQLGEQAASAFLLWATAADACGDQLTSRCVLDRIASIHAWTGGGMHAETDPSANRPPVCGLTLRVSGTRFVRAYPSEAGAFDCSPDYVRPVSGPLVERAQLGPDRVSTLFRR
jgi:ABC-type branched-subunit amino acid transport system substrate-binding protein